MQEAETQTEPKGRSMKGNLHGRDIILFSLKSWDSEIGSSSKKYAKVFAARNNRVLFVNRALDRMSAIKFRNDPKTRNRLESFRQKDKALKQVEENIWTLDPLTVLESINKIPFARIYDWLNKINGKRLAEQINKATARLGFLDIILYIENDFIRGQYLQDFLDHLDCTIYYIRDYLPSQAYFKTHGNRLEPDMIRKSDIVITNSLYLEKYAKKYNPKSFFVGQGCDTRLFSGENLPPPADMSGIKKPVIGYTGALLKTRLDIDLICRIAGRFSQCSLVLVGPEDEHFVRSELHGMKNVFFLGRKKLEELPAYVAHFDLCINPQVVNEMTIGNYPLKIDEYLAMGKAIVATRTEAMDMFAEYVGLAGSVDHFLDLIALALEHQDSAEEKEKRIAFARTHTWEQCVDGLEQALLNN